jgi:uncharacterized RDD family membrane protein YckC
MEQSIQTSVQSVTRGRRFTNYVIDYTLCNILILFVVYPMVRMLFGDAATGNFWSNLLLSSIVVFLYYFIFEAIFQKTPGKFITGTKVVLEDGSTPDINTIAKRSFIRVVPFEVISVYTGSEPDKKDTWWHDRWASTRVIKS